MLTQKRVRELLEYDFAKGIFICKKWRGGTARVNTKAGSESGDGRLLITIDGKKYLAHRLVWLWVYGCFPKNQIDHVNHNKLDNRLCNLRMATNQQNSANGQIRKSNNSGAKGVSWFSLRKKWRARIMVNYKEVHLGLFLDKVAAIRAYDKAAIQYFGSFAKTNASMGLS